MDTDFSPRSPNKKSEEILLSTKHPPMMTSLIPLIRKQIDFCNLLAIIPFEWDVAKGRLRLLESPVKLMACKIQIGIHVAYTTLIFAYFLSPQNLSSIPNSTRMMGLTFLVCFGATMLMRLTIWNMKTDVVHLFNNYLFFEETYLPACPRGYEGDKVSKIMMTLGFLTSVGLPGFIAAMLLVNPCQAPHIGYILFREGPSGCAVPGWPVRLTFLIFDTWTWVNCISSAIFSGFQVFFPGMKCLCFYIHLILEIYAANGVTTPAQDGFCFRVYQHLRVLGKLFNFCLQSVFIPTQITAGCMVLIIGLYTCVKLHAQIAMPGFAFFPLISCDGLAIIFITQVAAGVYTSSSKLVKKARRSRRYGRNAWFRKMVRATHFIKIRFGSTNFIDQMTPLVYLNFCLTQTVSLVLLS
ncbi:hypothetical protein Fcan01_00835 [Folsomia candida]|uniref:Odorant receptor n=2 Tax=Folsomia candida TaxID=158441 RepID=A0A226EYS8_FOLCA|nr:hypothetical protein Fcan01_00835 [Folsomia candida]